MLRPARHAAVVAVAVRTSSRPRRPDPTVIPRAPIQRAVRRSPALTQPPTGRELRGVARGTARCAQVPADFQCVCISTNHTELLRVLAVKYPDPSCTSPSLRLPSHFVMRRGDILTLQEIRGHTNTTANLGHVCPPVSATPRGRRRSGRTSPTRWSDECS